MLHARQAHAHQSLDGGPRRGYFEESLLNLVPLRERGVDDAEIERLLDLARNALDRLREL